MTTTNWMKTTIAEYSGEGPVFSYEPVDVSLIQPRKRDYSAEKKETAKASNGEARQLTKSQKMAQTRKLRAGKKG